MKVRVQLLIKDMTGKVNIYRDAMRYTTRPRLRLTAAIGLCVQKF